ncbi:hypothetical protein [Ralstonia syzygii]|uniref:hypothetical protein n=1 Tax=Ralstonia syzygii TaxID=28097 RepID=UPI003516079A
MSGGVSASTVIIAATAALSAGAAIYAGQQQKNVADANAELASRQAEQDQDAAVAQAEKIRKAARIQQAEATANLAASGVSVGAGTPLRISNEIYKNSEQDAYQTILSGNRAYTAGQAQSGLYSSQGNAAETSGYLNAGASLLSGASTAMRAGWQARARTTGTGSIQ